MHWLVPHIFAFVLPLFCSNVLHMLIVKRGWLSALEIPISERLFGPSKTYRGFAVLMVLTALCSTLFSMINYPDSVLTPGSMGLVLGFAYALGELPNSFIKRRRGIASGQKGERPFLQLLFDKSDSLVVMLIPYTLLMDIRWFQSLVLFALSFAIHLSFSWLFWKLNLKRSL